MTTKILAACMLAAITLSLLSCNWFGKKHEVTLVGNWKLRTVEDTTKGSSPYASILESFNPDSTVITVTFKTDSSVIISSVKTGADTAKYYIGSAGQEIYIKQDSTFKPYPVMMLDDSLFKVTVDNIHLTFKKQP